MTIRRQRREDPAYLTAMREAKELFDAEMAKNSMKGRGRPKTVVAAAPAAAEVEIDHEVTDEITDLATDDGDAVDAAGETDVEDVDVDVVAPPRVAKRAAKPASSASRANGKGAKASAKGRARAKKPAPKKKAAPAKKAARKR